MVYCLRIINYAKMRWVSQNVIPCEKFTPHLHNMLSKENVWCHPQQLCFSSLRGFASTQSALSICMLICVTRLG